MGGTAGGMEAAGMEIGMTGIAIHRHRLSRRHRLEVEASHVQHAQESTCLELGFVASAASQ